MYEGIKRDSSYIRTKIYMILEQADVPANKWHLVMCYSVLSCSCSVCMLLATRWKLQVEDEKWLQAKYSIFDWELDTESTPSK